MSSKFLVWSRMFSGPVCQRVVGGMVWNPELRRSVSSEHLETKSLPSRSPPSTPNWYGLYTELIVKGCTFISSILYLSSVRVLSFNLISSLTFLSARRSPRVRHGIRKLRPSSVELSSDLKDMSEGEDVFYTYRASVSSSKDGEDASVKLVSLSSSQAHFSLAVFLASWTKCLTRIIFNAVYYTKSNSFCNKCLTQVLKRTLVQQILTFMKLKPSFISVHLEKMDGCPAED